MDSGTQLQSPQDFLIIAHRGASSYAPENTIAAFDLALQMGASHLELDVHLTCDDSLVIIHDDTVDRTTNGTGPVASQTLTALRGLDAGSWFGEAFVGARIPTLAEVLTRYHGRAHLHIELKGHTAHLPQQTVDLVRAHGMAPHVTFTSFQHTSADDAGLCSRVAHRLAGGGDKRCRDRAGARAGVCTALSTSVSGDARACPTPACRGV